MKVDKKSKVIVDYSVTNASVHDINEFEGIIDATDKEAWLDSAYESADHVARIMGKYPGIILHICEKGKKNAPLTDGQKASNREKAKIRARVEQVFGYMIRFMGGITIRTIGIGRAEREIYGMNLAYNISERCFFTDRKACSYETQGDECALDNKTQGNGGDAQFILKRKIFNQNNIFIGKVVKNSEISKLGDSKLRF